MVKPDAERGGKEPRASRPQRDVPTLHRFIDKLPLPKRGTWTDFCRRPLRDSLLVGSPHDTPFQEGTEARVHEHEGQSRPRLAAGSRHVFTEGSLSVGRAKPPAELSEISARSQTRICSAGRLALPSGCTLTHSSPQLFLSAIPRIVHILIHSHEADSPVRGRDQRRSSCWSRSRR